MTEARDRLVREDRFLSGIRFGSPVSISPVRRINGGTGGGFVLFGSPMRQTAVTRATGVRDTPAPGMRRLGLFGQENSPTRGGGGGGVRRVRRNMNTSVLPSWYPRSPLQDVTAVVTAIERRRARMREADNHQLGSRLLLQELDVPTPNRATQGAPLEHDIFLGTPTPMLAAKKVFPLSVQNLPKSLQENNNEDSDYLTPQKRLLNSIDQVEKVVREELERMKRTPSAKRAERQKKVRTLMAMR